MNRGLSSSLLGAIKPSATTSMTKWKSQKFLMWDETSIRKNKNRNKGSVVGQLERPPLHSWGGGGAGLQETTPLWRHKSWRLHRPSLGARLGRYFDLILACNQIMIHPCLLVSNITVPENIIIMGLWFNFIYQIIGVHCINILLTSN